MRQKESSAIRFFLLGPAMVLALLLIYLGIRSGQTNIMGWLLAAIGLLYIPGGINWLWPGFHRQSRAVDQNTLHEPGDRSFWGVLPGFMIVFFGAPLEYLLLRRALTTGLAWQVLGLVIFCAGVGLTTWARQVLKSAYTGHIQVAENHLLITHGPYRWIRHPAYMGFLLITGGLAAGFQSIIAALAVLFLLLPGLVYRMRVEEGLLLRRFGKQYQDYMQRTHRLIPGLW